MCKYLNIMNSYRPRAFDMEVTSVKEIQTSSDLQDKILRDVSFRHFS